MKPLRSNIIPAGVNATLTVVDGPDRGRVKKIRSRRLVFGRKTGDLLLSDSKVSSTHGAIEYVNGNFVVYDLQSTNGTCVNDIRINEKTLEDLDEIRVGFSTLLFRVSYRKLRPSNVNEASYEDSKISTTSNTEIETAKDGGPDFSIDQNKIPKKQKLSLVFVVLEGPYKGQNMVADRENIVIGRVNSDIVLKDDRDVSRKHAIIEVINGTQIFIRDLASTNGTYVNDKRVASSRLSENDRIRVGNSVLEFTVNLEEYGD